MRTRVDEAKSRVQLTGWAAGLTYLAAATPTRLSSTQLAVFIFAALACRSGTPTTFTELRALFKGSPGGSVHTTYGVFLSTQRRGPSIGWLTQVPDPLDSRQKFLRLTPQGRAVIDKLLLVSGQIMAT